MMRAELAEVFFGQNVPCRQCHTQETTVNHLGGLAQHHANLRQFQGKK
jgi:hypothetical protein